MYKCGKNTVANIFLKISLADFEKFARRLRRLHKNLIS
jgi:hypothetical protein